MRTLSRKTVFVRSFSRNRHFPADERRPWIGGAHGQLEQRAAAAGRCNGQSSKGSIEGNEERTSEEISRRIKRKGETEREKRKKKRGENNTRTS